MTTYLYAVHRGIIYKVPYDLQARVANWNRARIWIEPPSKVRDDREHRCTHGKLMRCDVCGREKMRAYVGHCMCGGWMRQA